jgi:hypothetical protein
MMTVETIPGIWVGEMENDRGDEFKIYLICCENFCGCHYVPHPAQ